MSAVRWTERERIGFADVDQDRRIKFSSMIRFVGAGYAGLFSQLTTVDRADYFTTHGLTPITTYAQLERASRSTSLDTETELRYGVALGFVRGRQSDVRRYGGYDEIERSDAERGPLGASRNRHKQSRHLRCLPGAGGERAGRRAAQCRFP